MSKHTYIHRLGLVGRMWRKKHDDDVELEAVFVYLDVVVPCKAVEY